MGDRRASRYLSGVFGGSDPPDGLPRGQSSSDPLPEQSSGGQQPQQAALSLPATSRRNLLFRMFKSRSRSPSRSPPRPLGAPQSPDVVWTKVLEIAEKKLSDNNLPPLDRTSQLMAGTVEEHIQAVVNTLNILEKDNRKKGWSYTWRGKKVIVVEQLGKILKQATPYTKVLDIAIQANTQVRALAWAGVRAIMQVRINSSLYIAHTA